MTNDELRARLDSLSIVVDMVARTKRPTGWSRNAKAPYYNNTMALELQPLIDAMIVSKQPLLFEEKLFDLSKNTLYLKLNQSVRYMCDYLDKTGKYKAWKDLTKLTYSKKYGGWMFLYLDEQETTPLVGIFKVPTGNEGKVWKRRVDRWLESDTVEPLALEGICLTEQECLELKRELASLQGIEFSVSCVSISIIRI